MQILRSQVNPIFQSTPSVWRETLSGFHSFQCFTISIHSLRMEGDNCSHRVTLQNVHFNPLPPYGGRPERRCLAMKRFKFQSTPSVWRETFCSSAFRDTLSFQSTPSAWRETVQLLHLDMSVIFQSTPSAWRETVSLMDSARPSRDFNPLPPHGGRPVCMMLFTAKKRISIHSLRMEGDDRLSITTICRICISIHSLRMEGD